MKAGTIGADEAEQTLGRIRPTTSLEEAAAGADHAIESVVEDFAAKADVCELSTPFSGPTQI